MPNEFDYKKYLDLIAKNKRLFAVIALSIMTCAVILSYVLPKKYEAKSTVYVEKSIISDLVKGIAVTSSIEDKIKVLIYAMSSRTLILKVCDELDLNVKKHNEADTEEMVAKFQKNLDIKLKDKEGLFIISFLHEDPRVARDFVNALVRRYIEENVSTKREESYGATKFLSEQVTTFKEKLDKADAQVNNLKRQKGALITTDEGAVLKEISEAQQRLEELRMRRVQAESMLNLYKKEDPLRARLTDMQKRLAELRVQYTDSYPDIVNLKSDIATITQQLKERNGKGASFADPHELDKYELEVRSLRSSEDFQRRAIDARQGLLRSIPAARAELEGLEREKNDQKGLYDQLIARHGASEVSKQMEVQDKAATFRIVDPAVLPIKPATPNRVRIILLGLAAGLAGGLGFLLLLDYLDQSVRVLASLKTLGLPVLAVIPLMKSDNEIQLERKRDRRLYLLSGCWFSIILVVLVMEAFDVTLIDSMLSGLFPTQLAAMLTGWIK
jgi:polysaccharide chain length determinant protein (PEP-CTERM system associated)